MVQVVPVCFKLAGKVTFRDSKYIRMTVSNTNIALINKNHYPHAHFGILVEKKFRQKIEQINWQKYENENVLIKGCSQAPIPTWAYLIITSNLANYARKIYFGEARRAIEIYKRL